MEGGCLVIKWQIISMKLVFSCSLAKVKLQLAQFVLCSALRAYLWGVSHRPRTYKPEFHWLVEYWVLNNYRNYRHDLPIFRGSKVNGQTTIALCICSMIMMMMTMPPWCQCSPLAADAAWPHSRGGPSWGSSAQIGTVKVVMEMHTSAALFN